MNYNRHIINLLDTIMNKSLDFPRMKIGFIAKPKAHDTKSAKLKGLKRCQFYQKI